MATDKVEALPSIGGWEWVALPEHGIACLRARVDTTQESSSLRATDLEVEETGGEPVLRFKVHPLADDPSTFVVVEASCEAGADPQPAGSGPPPVIKTALTIGEVSFSAPLEIVEGPPGPWPLTLGRTAVDGRFEVDPGREALAGPPMLAWRPRADRGRTAHPKASGGSGRRIPIAPGADRRRTVKIRVPSAEEPPSD